MGIETEPGSAGVVHKKLEEQKVEPTTPNKEELSFKVKQPQGVGRMSVHKKAGTEGNKTAKEEASPFNTAKIDTISSTTPSSQKKTEDTKS